MKKIFQIYLLLFTALFTSCGKEFLEVEPKGSLIATRTVEYENMLYNSLSIGTEVPSIYLGDDVAMLNTYFETAPLRVQRMFRWEPDFYEIVEDASELQVPMSNIYIYNKIINEVMASKDGSEAYKLSILAEARASRAYFNLMLANNYSKPYSAATAATDLSIPLVTKADVSETSFNRATVKQVYDNMIEDLKESIPLIPINQSLRSRVSRAAAELILAKIYWFMGDYDNALKMISTAQTHYPTSFPNAIYDYNVTYAAGNWSLQSSTANTENLLTRTSVSFTLTSSNTILLAPWVRALYSTTDQRLKSYSTITSGNSIPLPAGLSRRTGPFGINISQGVSLPDVELMKAECEARLNKLSEAKTTLQNFRAKRMSTADAVVSINDQNQLIKFIIEERVREFALYGYRWYDIRRLSTDPLFKDEIYKHVKYSAQTAGPLDTYTLQPDRLVLRFPLKVIEFNPDMPNNM